MSKKLEIGKTEIVIYPERGHSCVISERISGSSSGYGQRFSSSKLPEKLIAVYIGREIIEGEFYDKYILKEIPEELERLRLEGEAGFKNQSAILDSVAEILRAETEDGKQIKYVRSVTDEDINKLFNILVDFENKKVYQEEIDKDINVIESFGNSLRINSHFSRREIERIRRHIKSEYIYLTSYRYYNYNIELPAKEYLKKLVFLEKSYYLNSPGVFSDSGDAYFGPGIVRDGYVCRGDYYLFCSNGYSSFGFFAAVRPVFYLESDNQNKFISIKKDIVEQQEKITLLEKNIAKMQKDLKKEKEKLEKMINQVSEIV